MKAPDGFHHEIVPSFDEETDEQIDLHFAVPDGFKIPPMRLSHLKGGGGYFRAINPSFSQLRQVPAGSYIWIGGNWELFRDDEKI